MEASGSRSSQRCWSVRPSIICAGDGQQGTEATAWHKVVLELNRRLVVAQVEATRSQIKIHAGNCLGDLRASSRDFLSRAVEYHSGRGSRVYSSGI